ncbi:hypothetical protein ACFWP7_00115 [Streptomyces sp. NPDC058470]|uniref:hypothetical protein n=1 Tax=Streptomyces sp. NPDC058470 TaxID=3346515 RepID=UPI003653018A
MVAATVDATGVEAVVRGDAALRRSLYGPVADAVGSKVGQQALPSTGGGAPLRPSMVYWAYRNYEASLTSSGTRLRRRIWRWSVVRQWRYGSC